MLCPPNGPFVRLMDWIAAKLVVIGTTKLVVIGTTKLVGYSYRQARVACRPSHAPVISFHAFRAADCPLADSPA